MLNLKRQEMKDRSFSFRRRFRPIQRPAKVQPRMEELESRLAPAGGLLNYLPQLTVTPGVQLVHPGAAAPANGAGLPPGFSPGQISQAYGFNQITFRNGTVRGDGTGQTIAIIDAYDQPNIASDLATFDATYGLPDPPSFTKVNQSGGTNYPGADPSWGLEITLDVEWAHAMAPGANILLVEANSNSLTDLIAAVDYARNQPGVAVVSMSWGSGEWNGENRSGENTMDWHFTTPSGHSGVTFVASTGDTGSTGAPEYPSVSPNVLAVGGTELSTDSAGNYLGETAWSGSGGGISTVEFQPVYQKGVSNSGMRTVPDVAYDASSNSPFAIYDSYGYSGWVQVGGTSAGAPQWAALVAIADQGRALAGEGALDGAKQTLPMLYQLPASAFNDITSGSNGAYSAGPGYDLVTGLGSPVANLVVSGLINPSTPPAQQPPTVVTPASANPNPVTGTTATLSVLGSDAAGATSLTYTWSVTSAPAGAATPTFLVNGNNVAQNTVATFHAAGTYTFLVTITDPAGLTATSTATVTVNQTATTLTVSPGSASVADGTTQQFTASALDQFSNTMAAPASLGWSIASGMGTIDSGGLYSAPASGSGTATVQATDVGITGSVLVTITSPTPAPQPPTVVTPASATPNSVTGTTANLSVLGDDVAGASSLTYTWSVTSAPANATPTFSSNGTNAAQNTVATFQAAGTYTFLVTITDPAGLTATSTVTVTVNQTCTSVTISPGSASVADGTTQQFTASALDQFGNPMAAPPSLAWSVTDGMGTINSGGLYSAPASGSGTATVLATGGGITGSVLVTITSPTPAPQPPTVVTPASATPNPVTGTTANLSVLGDDAAGASSLAYTWSVTSAPANATPTFSSNGTNAAQNTVATFQAAGTYTFLVTITDPAGLTATSTVTVTVNQTCTSVTISPGSASVADGATQQFKASALDQFGNAMVTPLSWTWSVASGLGTINSSGLYSAPASGTGTATIQVTGGEVTRTATVTVTAGATRPVAPSNLTATAISTHQVKLAWRSNSTNLSGFLIQRSTDGKTWTLIGRVGAGITTYSDTKVLAGKTYFYRVFAYNRLGESPASNVARVITPNVQLAGLVASGSPALGSNDGGLAGSPRATAADFSGLPGSWASVSVVDFLAPELTGGKSQGSLSTVSAATKAAFAHLGGTQDGDLIAQGNAARELVAC
jgi:hypothetical protein